MACLLAITVDSPSSMSSCPMWVIRVRPCSWASTGPAEREKPSCTGPWTRPHSAFPVVMTAPNMRTSKKAWHIHCRAWSWSAGLAVPGCRPSAA